MNEGEGNVMQMHFNKKAGTLSDMSASYAPVPTSSLDNQLQPPVIIGKKPKKFNKFVKFLFAATGINFLLIIIIAIAMTSFQTKNVTKSEFSEVTHEIARMQVTLKGLTGSQTAGS